MKRPDRKPLTAQEVLKQLLCLFLSLIVLAPLDLVVIQLGCNELKHMFNLSTGMIARGVERLVQECKLPL